MNRRVPSKDDLRLSRINALIADFDDEDLATMRPAAMERIPPEHRALIGDKPVRASRWLRTAVYEMLEQARVAAGGRP